MARACVHARARTWTTVQPGAGRPAHLRNQWLRDAHGLRADARTHRRKCLRRGDGRRPGDFRGGTDRDETQPLPRPRHRRRNSLALLHASTARVSLDSGPSPCPGDQVRLRPAGSRYRCSASRDLAATAASQSRAGRPLRRLAASRPGASPDPRDHQAPRGDRPGGPHHASAAQRPGMDAAPRCGVRLPVGTRAPRRRPRRPRRPATHPRVRSPAGILPRPGA